MFRKLIAALLLTIVPSLAVAAEIGTIRAVHIHPDNAEAYFEYLFEPDSGGLDVFLRSVKPSHDFHHGDRAMGTKVKGAWRVEPLKVSAAGVLASHRVEGAFKTLVMLVNFENDRREPVTAEQVRSWMPASSTRWNEWSYGSVTLPADVVGWLQLPMSNVGCAFWSMQSAADRAAIAAGVNLSAYAKRVYLFPYAPSCQFGGLGTVGGNPSSAWINGVEAWQLVNHELGHNFGLYHSHGKRCGTQPLAASGCKTAEYGDSADIMGGNTGAHPNPFQKLRLGWLDTAGMPAVTTVTASGTYRIFPYENPGVGPNALLIKRGTLSEAFYVSSQHVATLVGYSGVYIRIAHPSLPDSSYMLDMTPTTVLHGDEHLGVGKSFTDPLSGITLTTLSYDKTAGAIIKVDMGGLSCSRAAPTLAVTTASPVIQAGGTVSVVATVTSADTQSCPSSSFTLQDTQSALRRSIQRGNR